MSRRPAPITEAEMNRALKVAKKAGAREVVIETAGASVRIVLDNGETQEKVKAKLARKPVFLL